MQVIYKKSSLESNLHENLCQHIQFEFVKKGGVVFYYGMTPDRFYITLQGQVMVLVPYQKADRERQAKEEKAEDEQEDARFFEQLSSSKPSA